MGLIVIAAMGLLVVYLATKTPEAPTGPVDMAGLSYDSAGLVTTVGPYQGLTLEEAKAKAAGTGGALPPVSGVPALGATGAPSPAKANGSAQISKVVSLQLSNIYKLTASVVPPTVVQKKPKSGVLSSFQQLPSPNLNVMPPPQVQQPAFTGGGQVSIHSKGGDVTRDLVKL